MSESPSPNVYFFRYVGHTFSRMGIFHNFMNLKAVYIHIGWFQMSITNLIVILFMVLLFILALVVPFPGSKKGKNGGDRK